MTTGSNTKTNYYAFGMPMPGRSYQSSSSYRYGMNGKEKDDEIVGSGNSYNFGERQYDPRLGRWISIDPHANKYANMSPYIYAANSPVWVLDPDGGDIIVLSAPGGANGLGHAAVLIGNDKEGWTLYSKNGTTQNGGVYGKSNKNPQDGIKVGTLSEFAEKYNKYEKGGVEYTGAIKITTSKEQDAKMASAASKAVSSNYDVTGGLLGSTSCIDVASDALRAGGLDPGNEKGPVGMGQQAENLPRDPNTRFNNIVKNNNNTVVTNDIIPKAAKDAKAAQDKKDQADQQKALDYEQPLTPMDNTGVAPKTVDLPK